MTDGRDMGDGGCCYGEGGGCRGVCDTKRRVMTAIEMEQLGAGEGGKNLD